MSDLSDLAHRWLSPERGYPRTATWIILAVVAVIVVDLLT